MLVDLEDDGARRPVQPVGPGVQPRSQDHDLADTRGRGVGEERVEEMCPDHLVAVHVLEDGRGLGSSAVS